MLMAAPFAGAQLEPAGQLIAFAELLTTFFERMDLITALSPGRGRSRFPIPVARDSILWPKHLSTALS